MTNETPEPQTIPPSGSSMPPSVPSAGPAPDPGPGSRRGLWLGIGLLTFVLFVVAVTGFAVKTDYVALVPGRAQDTEPLIEIEGTEEFPSDGELLLTTVRVRQGLSVWEYLWYRRDDQADLLEQRAVLGDRTPEENREYNFALMDTSKETAVSVALEELGFDAIFSDGVLVVEVVEGASADGVLVPGDVLRGLDGDELTSANALILALTDRAPGDTVTLSGETADGDVFRREVTLGARDDDPDAAFLGIGPTDVITFADDLPFVVDIDTGEVGGPSAGLAFTLAILDQLTEGELTGGTRVAATGTIAPDGSVGPVGGVPQKTVAVRESGAELFLIPAGLTDDTVARIRELAGDELRVEVVASLDEALALLEELGGDVESVADYAAANPAAS